MRKPSKFLITVACTQPNPDYNRGWRRGLPLPELLTHTRYHVTPAPSLQLAMDVASGIAADHARRMQTRDNVGDVSVINVAPYRPKKIKARVPVASRARDDAREKRKAVQYAEWLARRDGVTLPSDSSLKCQVVWSGVNSLTRGCWETRAEAVEWVHEYRENKGTWKRPRYEYHSETVLRIDLPNWDFNPVAPVETIETDALPLAA